jgi:membrane-associated phospholipid phosphatase
VRHLFFILICLLATLTSAQSLDLKLLDKLNGPVQPSVDKPWQFMSNTVAPVAIATPVSMFIVGCATHNKDLRIQSYNAGVSFLFANAVTTTLKFTVNRTRPFTAYPDLIYKKGTGGPLSFPSGHTTNAFATATSLSLAFPRWYVIVPAYTYAIAIGYSRMYLGMHYPSDVIVGALIGIGASFLTFQTQKWITGTP